MATPLTSPHPPPNPYMGGRSVLWPRSLGPSTAVWAGTTPRVVSAPPAGKGPETEASEEQLPRCPRLLGNTACQRDGGDSPGQGAGARLAGGFLPPLHKSCWDAIGATPPCLGAAHSLTGPPRAPESLRARPPGLPAPIRGPGFGGWWRVCKSLSWGLRPRARPSSVPYPGRELSWAC